MPIGNTLGVQVQNDYEDGGEAIFIVSGFPPSVQIQTLSFEIFNKDIYA